MQYVTHIERRGIERGLQQGIERGRQQGQAEILRRQLIHRFGSLPEWAEERLQGARREDLETWSLRVFDGERLEEVLDGTCP